MHRVSLSFPQYLLSRRSAPLLAILLWSIALILSIYIAIPVLRWLISIPYLLFTPGYSLLTLLYREKEQDVVERFTFSLGLSLCLVALIGVLLSLTPLGITANSVAVSLSGFNLASLLTSKYLRYFREGDR